MTAPPVTVEAEQPLLEARALMRNMKIRHLPVLDRGRLVGMLSQRDVLAFEAAEGVEAAEARVRDAMSAETYVVRPDSFVQDVARHMAEHRADEAVVVDSGKVVGIFTCVDALRALSLLLRQVQQSMA